MALPKPQPPNNLPGVQSPGGNFKLYNIMNPQQIKFIAETVKSIRGNFWRLSGPGAKHIRARVIEAATGKKPLAKDCGINKMMACLYEAFPVSGWTCEAVKDRMLADAIGKADS